MSVFGNGVLSGWMVTATGTFAVSISEGLGNINFTSARTSFPSTLSNIPPNSIRYVYARIKETTGFTENIDFILSPTRNLTGVGFLLLAEVITGAASIESIDNSVRQNIGFLELIKAAIKQHKHRGGSLNPSKIDLGSEVNGQLPSFRIADFDAEKVTTGTFDLARLPLIDHQDLQNVGLLTHPQLDSFVKTLQASNKELFGEIGTANLLQLILAMKLVHDDPNSAFYISDRTVDQNMINEFAIIPGITPNSYIDFDNSTAEINLEDHYIKGIPPVTGTSFFVTYNTNLSWQSAYRKENVVISGDRVTLAFNDDDEANIKIIEGFEGSTEPGEDLSGNQGAFRKETILLVDNAHIIANSSSTNVVEGFYSGKFAHQQSFRNQFVKEFETSQDWTTYDSFVLHIKSLDSIHGSVKVYFENSSGEKSSSFTILSENEVTDNNDPVANNFEMRVIELALISFRNDIKKLVIYTDDLENPFNFYVDLINIQRAILLPEQGSIVLRYSSNTKVSFSTISWQSIEPSGTEIKVRVRSASGTVFLNRSEYTPYINNGDAVNLEGTDIEIEATLLSGPDRLNSPVLTELRILILSEAEIDGFVINSTEELNRGDESNVTINTSPVSVSISTPISVGSYYFALSNLVGQLREEIDSNGNSFASSELSISGLKLPISPNYVFKFVEQNFGTITVGSFFEPRSVRRLQDKSFVIADTYNDRVVQVDENGNLLSGFGSINYEHQEKIYPIAASFDIRTSILYIVWSRRISFKTVNVSKIVIKAVGQQEVQLIKDSDKILNLSTSDLEQIEAEGQIMPIYLSTQNSGTLKLFPATNSYILVSSDAIATGLNTDSVFYRVISNANGIPLYVGNFAYIDGVYSPSWADKSDKNSFIVCNSTVAVKEFSFPTTVTESLTKQSNVSSIIEVDENNNIVYASNKVLFSPFFPGRAERIDGNTLLIAGMKPSGEQEDIEGFNFRSFANNPSVRTQQKTILNSMLFQGEKPFIGTVIVIDTRTGSTTFEYTCPEGILASDVDVDPRDGLYVVAESSLNNSGRIIKLDALGNITFSFGEGLYSIINDVEIQTDGSIVIST